MSARQGGGKHSSSRAGCITRTCSLDPRWAPCVYNHLPPKIVEQPSVSRFQAERQRLVKGPGQGEMRGLGPIALSSRALQPPFATLPVTGHVRLSPKIIRHRRRNRTAQQPILVRACDTEAPAQSTCAQGARWHGLPLPPPRPYIYLRPLTPTSLRHRRRNRTAQQPIPVHACNAEAHFSAVR